MRHPAQIGKPMFPSKNERRPHTPGTASNPTDPATTSEPESAPILPEAPRAVDMLNGVFVVLVAHKVTGELRYRRRIFLDLRAAERHAARCTMNGQRASVTLCRLAPVHEFAGGWGA